MTKAPKNKKPKHTVWLSKLTANVPRQLFAIEQAHIAVGHSRGSFLKHYGFNHSQYIQVLSQASQISFALLEAYAAALSVSPLWLMDLNNDYLAEAKRPPPPPCHPTKKAREQSLWAEHEKKVGGALLSSCLYQTLSLHKFFCEQWAAGKTPPPKLQ